MYEFKVKGMTCPSCARSMKKALLDLDPLVDVEVNLPAQTVKVKSDRSQGEIAARLEDAGYPVVEGRAISSGGLP